MRFRRQSCLEDPKSLQIAVVAHSSSGGSFFKKLALQYQLSLFLSNLLDEGHVAISSNVTVDR